MFGYFCCLTLGFLAFIVITWYAFRLRLDDFCFVVGISGLLYFVLAALIFGLSDDIITKPNRLKVLQTLPPSVIEIRYEKCAEILVQSNQYASCLESSQCKKLLQTFECQDFFKI